MLKYVVLTVLVTSCKGDYGIGLAGPRPDVVFGANNDRFDISEINHEYLSNKARYDSRSLEDEGYKKKKDNYEREEPDEYRRFFDKDTRRRNREQSSAEFERGYRRPWDDDKDEFEHRRFNNEEEDIPQRRGYRAYLNAQEDDGYVSSSRLDGYRRFIDDEDYLSRRYSRDLVSAEVDEDNHDQYRASSNDMKHQQFKRNLQTIVNNIRAPGRRNLEAETPAAILYAMPFSMNIKGFLVPSITRPQ